MKINASPPKPVKVDDLVTAAQALGEEVKNLAAPAPPEQKAQVTVSTTSTAPTSTAPKVSWLKKVGHFIGSILKFAATEEPKIAAIAEPALAAAFPQFSALIQAGDALASKITKQILVSETVGAAVASASSGEAKFNAVLAGVGPEIDAWVQAAFPGAKTLSTPGKTALINAFVTVANEVEADVLPPATTNPS